jgi:hypothetical protein
MHLSHTAPGEGTANAPRRVPSLIKVKLAEEGAVSLALSSCVFSRESRSARKTLPKFQRVLCLVGFQWTFETVRIAGGGDFSGGPKRSNLLFARVFADSLKTNQERSAFI